MIDRDIMDATRLAIRVSSMGRAARSKAGLKVRQPLAEVVVKTRTPGEQRYLLEVRPQVLEELNIKELRATDADSALYADAQAAAGDDAGHRGVRQRLLRRAGGRLHGGGGRPANPGTG